MPPSTSSKRPRHTRRPERKLSTAVPRPRTHAFTGCLTCRERHVKCDLGQPICQNCARLKIPCEGYARKYSWMSPKIAGQRRRLSPDLADEMEEGQSCRRVLFSDEEREAMVMQMKQECSLVSSDLDLDRVL